MHVSEEFKKYSMQIVLSTYNEVKIAIGAMDIAQLNQEKVVYYLLDVSSNS